MAYINVGNGWTAVGYHYGLIGEAKPDIEQHFGILTLGFSQSALTERSEKGCSQSSTMTLIDKRDIAEPGI